MHRTGKYIKLCSEDKKDLSSKRSMRKLKCGLCAIIVFLFLLLFCGIGYSCKSNEFTEKYITLGCPLSLGFPDGIASRDNIQLAVDSINAAGGVKINGELYKFKAEFMDTRDLEPGVPTSEALLAVEKLILDKKADIIIGGPLRSEAALAAMDLMAKYRKITVVSAGVLSPAYDKKIAENYEKYKYCFRTTGSVIPMIEETINIMEKLRMDHGFNRAYIMVQDVAHARSAGDEVQKKLSEIGWTITGYDRYPTGSNDFSQGLFKVRDTNSRVLIPWMDMPESSTLMQQWHSMQIPALICGYLNAALDSNYWSATNGKCEYVVVVYPKAGIVASPALPLAQAYIELHKKTFGTEPGLTGWSPVCYQAVYIVKDAIERATGLNTDALIEALESTDMQGVYGRIRFDKKSHQIIYSTDPSEGATGCWTQWLNGHRVIVYPPAIATNKILLPTWMR